MTPEADALRRAAWRDTDARVDAFGATFLAQHERREFGFVQALAMQGEVPARLRRRYEVPVSYLDWGPRDAPVLVCGGGVANSAMRFCFLARALCDRFRVVCLDWLGRGHSGWLADDREYHLGTYVAQLRQLLDVLGARRVSLLGSSLGGSVALAFAARWPARVERLILNDVGPALASGRRRRRAETLARFYVFRDPQDLLRRSGAAQKHEGPLTEDVRLFLAYHQTRWSEENGGRVYRHDPRAFLAYRRDAANDVDQWAHWQAVRAPVLLLHGLESDALEPRTIAQMRRARPMDVAHVPRTGHTPALWSPSQVAGIRDWLLDPAPAGVEYTML